MKAFIEVDAGTDQRPIYNEQTLEQIGIKKVYKPYPYAYGFLLDTISGDGDQLDCYVITSKSLTSGDTIDVEPIGMVESVENGEEDHKILCQLSNETITINSTIEKEIRDFGEHYFDDRPDKQVVGGRFLGYQDAIKLIDSCRINTKKDK
ncbi:MAG: inorganic diphosphatase [Patescibacteria group bacterium]|nr:inorganic diphosphatase [Patescibacteria group bacterium]